MKGHHRGDNVAIPDFLRQEIGPQYGPDNLANLAGSLRIHSQANKAFLPGEPRRPLKCDDFPAEEIFEIVQVSEHNSSWLLVMLVGSAPLPKNFSGRSGNIIFDSFPHILNGFV